MLMEKSISSGSFVVVFFIILQIQLPSITRGVDQTVMLWETSRPPMMLDRLMLIGSNIGDLNMIVQWSVY